MRPSWDGQVVLVLVAALVSKTFALARSPAKENKVVFFSPNFRRHVVGEYTRDQGVFRPLGSYLWLDEAEAQHPNARRVIGTDTPRLPEVAGVGVEGPDDYYGSCETVSFPLVFLEQEYEATRDQAKSLMQSLDSKLGSPFLGYFPDGEHPFVVERIHYLLAPQTDGTGFTDDTTNHDFRNSGLGLTVPQAVSAILSLPHLLSVADSDTAPKRPPIHYFLQQLKVPFRILDEARRELKEYLNGASPEDVASCAFLNSIGISWEQCRLLLRAFSMSFIVCELDPSWELQQSGPVKKRLSHDALMYLRNRLHLSPADVFAMILTHSRLSSYTKQMLCSHTQNLQQIFGFSSNELCRVIIRQPSILGVSEAKLQRCHSFLSKQVQYPVQMTDFDIKVLLSKMPSMVQYNIEDNLHPKVQYLAQTVGMDKDDILRAVKTNPRLLGVSFNHTMRPSYEGLAEACSLSKAELRIIFTQVPQLLGCNWKTNLSPKLLYLTDRLSLDESALRSIVMTTPRILMHSITTSLEPKVHSLQRILLDEQKLSEIITNNPSLLLMNQNSLTERIRNIEITDLTAEEALSKKSTSVKSKVRRRRTREVAMKNSDGDVVEVFSRVEEAALQAQTTKANMYNIIKHARIYGGFSYSYQDPRSIEAIGENNSSLSTDIAQERQPTKLQGLLQGSSVTFSAPSDHKNGEDSERSLVLSVMVSGKTFPSENKSEVRGKMKSGGLVIYLPQLRGHLGAAKILEKAARGCLMNQIMPDAMNGTKYEDGLILLGYPYLKPSQNRCGLYVCRDALRLTLELLMSEELNPSSAEASIDVDIVTDSLYVFTLLQNSTDLLEWGSHTRHEDQSFEGPVQEWRANTDILYPLSRTFYRTVTQDLPPDILRKRTRRTLGKSINITFRHKSEILWSIYQDDPYLGDLESKAKTAAEWQFRLVQSALF